MAHVSRASVKTALIFRQSAATGVPASSFLTLPINPPRVCHNSYRKRWSPKEDVLLTAMRSVGRPWDEILPQFPGRTATAVKARWNTITPRSEDGRLLNYWGPKQLRFSAEEDERLKKLAKPERHAGKYDNVVSHLPGRGRTSVVNHYRRALQPQLRGWNITNKQKKWSKDETMLLLTLRNAGKLEYHEIGAQLGRSAESIRTRYSKAMRALKDSRITRALIGSLLRKRITK